MDQAAVGQPQAAGNPFVVREIIADVLLVVFEGVVGSALVEDFEVGPRLSAQDQQMSADHPDRLINQGQSAGPHSVVQRGVVQGRDDAVEVVLLTHGCAE